MKFSAMMLPDILHMIIVLICYAQDLLVPSLMGKGVMFSSNDLSMVPGTPIKPMLAKYV